jgi:3-dehydroquinate dehydratase/shikimate dehydrogenase
MNLAAPGQLDPRELEEVYHFREINSDTKLFGEIGAIPGDTERIKFLNRRFKDENSNAVCVPLCRADGRDDEGIEQFLSLASEIGLSGALINEPFDKTIIPFLNERTEEVRNTARCTAIIGEANMV